MAIHFRSDELFHCVGDIELPLSSDKRFFIRALAMLMFILEMKMFLRA